MMEYNKDNPLKVFTAFSGYDSQCLSMNRLRENFPDFDYELVGWSEIDDAANTAHDALFPNAKDKQFGDISKISWSEVPDFDVFTYSFPCTDISAAGVQAGLKRGSGTRSSLLWECEKAIAEKRPSYLLLENVKALTQQKFYKDFQEWLRILESYGYDNYWQVLDSSQYGVPQHRDRVFVVSIRRDVDQGYEFPLPFKLEKCLADVLEDDVDESYFLSDTMLSRFAEKSMEEDGNKDSADAMQGSLWDDDEWED